MDGSCQLRVYARDLCNNIVQTFNTIGVNKVYDYRAPISLYDACCVNLGLHCNQIAQLGSVQGGRSCTLYRISAFLYELWIMCQIYLATGSVSATGMWILHDKGNKVVDELIRDKTIRANLLWNATAFLGFLRQLSMGALLNRLIA